MLKLSFIKYVTHVSLLWLQAAKRVRVSEGKFCKRAQCFRTESFSHVVTHAVFFVCLFLFRKFSFFLPSTAAAFQQGKITPSPFPGGPPPGQSSGSLRRFHFKLVMLNRQLIMSLCVCLCVNQGVLLDLACFQRPLWELRLWCPWWDLHLTEWCPVGQVRQLDAFHLEKIINNKRTKTKIEKTLN